MTFLQIYLHPSALRPFSIVSYICHSVAGGKIVASVGSLPLLATQFAPVFSPYSARHHLFCHHYCCGDRRIHDRRLGIA